jgi:predicted HTH domain antitoxin
MTLTLLLPDDVPCAEITADEARLDMACSMFARGALSKISAAALAGVDFFQFQGALAERHISSYTDEMLEQDMKNLASLKAA